MANFELNGKTYAIPEMNFIAIERAWPSVLAATNSVDPVLGAGHALSVIAAALMEMETFDPREFGAETTDSEELIFAKVSYSLKKQLKFNEVGKVRDFMFDLLKEAGLEVSEGEALAVLMAAQGTAQEEATPLLETAPDTSSSSLPQDAREGAGTQ